MTGFLQSVVQHLAGQGAAQNDPTGGGGGGGGESGGGEGGRGGRGVVGGAESPGRTVDEDGPDGRDMGLRSSSRKVGPSNSSTAPKPTSSRATSTKNSSNPEDVQCTCGLPAVLKTVVKETASKGRQFWTCSNHDGCGFFGWADEGTVASSSRMPITSVPAKRPYSTVS
jgi:DNA topoisomerase III